MASAVTAISEYLRELEAEARVRAVVAGRKVVQPFDILVACLNLLISFRGTPESIRKSALGLAEAIPALRGGVRTSETRGAPHKNFERARALDLHPSSDEALHVLRVLLMEWQEEIGRGPVQWTHMVRLVDSLTELESAHKSLLGALDVKGLGELQAWSTLVNTIAAKAAQEEHAVGTDAWIRRLRQEVLSSAQTNAYGRGSRVIEPVDFVSALLDLFVAAVKRTPELEMPGDIAAPAVFRDWFSNPPQKESPLAVSELSPPSLHPDSESVLARITAALPTAGNWQVLAVLIHEIAEENYVAENLSKVLSPAHAGSVRNWARRIRNEAMHAPYGAQLPKPDELVVVADLDQVPPEVVARFIAALDRYHRAIGGSGLKLKDDHVGSVVLSEAEAL